MYTHPFSAWYWRDASRELRDLRKLLFAALMIAMCVVLAQVPSVPLLIPVIAVSIINDLFIELKNSLFRAPCPGYAALDTSQSRPKPAHTYLL